MTNQGMNNSQVAIDQQDEFWKKTRVWADTQAKDFLSYRWSVCQKPLSMYDDAH